MEAGGFDLSAFNPLFQGLINHTMTEAITKSRGEEEKHDEVRAN